MTDRIPLDHLTSDALDALYEQLDKAEQETTATATAAAHLTSLVLDRAERAEARLQHLQASSEAAGTLLTRTTDERDQLQAAVDRVRQLHQPTGVVAAAEFGNPPDCPVCGPNVWPCPTYNAVTELEPKEQPDA